MAADLERVALRPLAVREVDDPHRQPEDATLDRGEGRELVLRHPDLLRRGHSGAALSSTERSTPTPRPGRSESVTRPRSARGSSGNATQKI